ncbi:MAG: NAD-dependent epimerase/dehydratase family protein [Verrucomicrobiota bacterium]
MRILVTGGAGFIGSHTIKALHRHGHTTAIFDDFNDFYDPRIKRTNAAESGSEIFEGDLRIAADVENCFAAFKPEAVIHLAARAGVRPSLSDPRLYLDTNVTGTLNILESMKDHQVGKLVFGSSSSVYGCNEKVPFAEQDPIRNTISPYAATKVTGENLCNVYSHLYGIKIVALRFFTVYGPAQRPDLAIHKFTRKIWNGEPIQRFGDGKTRRDYTYVDDIVQGITKALDYNDKDYDVFNLGESRTVELRELIELIEKSIGKEAVIEALPEQPGDVPVTYADITKAKELLGYHPTTQIEDGIAKFADWFKSTQT